MPLEPMPALTVASSVITFVDFTGKLISTGIELYRNDTLVEHAELKTAAELLLSLRDSIVKQRDSQTMMQQDSQLQNSPVSFESLRRAQSHCIQCAEEVIEAVRKLTVTGQHRKWQSFRHALSSVMGNKKLDTAAQRLSDARQQFILFLLLHEDAVSRKNSEKQFHATTSLEERILHAVNSTHAELSRELSQLRDGTQHREQSEQDICLSLHDPALQRTLAAAENVLDSDLTNMAQTNFLATLQFSQINDRSDTVPEAYGTTFRWAVEHGSQTDENKSWHSFALWAESSEADHRIYWVTGQPGSGKSTLMKYLASSPTSLQLFKLWASDRPVVLAQCYFWAPGTDLQKSLEGMLRTLISQLVEHESTPTSIIENICPLRWHQAYVSRRQSSQWTLPELKKIFRLILEHLMQHTNVVLFVDGLDEYGKETIQRQELVDLFLSLEALPRLKICLSSRPWNVFSDAFQSHPSLQLESLNRPDILAYVTAKCGDNAAFQELASINQERAEALKRKIVARSSGVFLWVTLVVKRLLEEMQDGPGLLCAEDILAEMPQGLDEYFQLMLERARPEDQAQVSRIYQVLLFHSAYTDSLMLLSFTNEKSDNFAELNKTPSADSPKIRVLSMKRLFKSQSMDLLVWRPKQGRWPGFLPWDDCVADFLHRTVHDYLLTQPAQDLLQRFTVGKFDTCWYTVNALVSQFWLIRALHPAPVMKELRYSIREWFTVFLLVLSSTSSNHSAAGNQYFMQVAGYALNTIAIDYDVDPIMKAVACASVDDAKLLLGMVCNRFSYVAWSVNHRGRLLPQDYCEHYIRIGSRHIIPGDLSDDGRPSSYMLAFILKHTERSPSRIYKDPNLGQGHFKTSAEAYHFAVSLLREMQDLEFSSTKERTSFSIYVDSILATLCIGYLEDNYGLFELHLTYYRKTWTVSPKRRWKFGRKVVDKFRSR